MIKWPRGKYNGQRIVGFEVMFRMRFDLWRWKPIKVKYQGLFHWLCFTLKFEAVYEH